MIESSRLSPRKPRPTTMRPAFIPYHVLAILALVALIACDSDDPVTPDPPVPAVWSEITNLPASVTLYGLWAPRADLIVGVGSKGNIWQWDGQRWTQRPNPSPR